MSIALTGDGTRFTGPARSFGYRWFTDPAVRAVYLPEDHAYQSRLFAAGLRRLATLRGPGSAATWYVDLLLAENEEFRAVWAEHEVGLQPREVKRFVHPELGVLELNCQTLIDPGQSHVLVVYTAVPGTGSYEKVQQLAPSETSVRVGFSDGGR